MTETPLTHPCPRCRRTNDAVSSAFGDHQPVPGDITICLHCCAICLFSDTMSVVLPSDAELDAIKKSDAWPQIQALTRAMVRAKFKTSQEDPNASR